VGHPSPQDPGGPILIGLRDLYVQLQALDRSVTALNAAIQMQTQQQTLNAASVAQQLADFRHDMNDHETRIRLQEARVIVSPRSMWLAVGTIAPIVSIIVTILIAVSLGK
jgi:hypothetical protein